jgi:hypothetical protein
MFESIKKALGIAFPPPLPPEPVKIEKPKTPRKPKEEPPALSPKEIATAAGEPYVNIISVDLDPNDINNGAFQLDWNDKFMVNLVKQGYKFSPSDTEDMIVDRWFQTVCRNIALEVYEQEIADPEKRDDIRVIQQRDLGNGYTEVQ